MKYDIPAILVAAKQAWKFRYMQYPDDRKEDRQSNVKSQTSPVRIVESYRHLSEMAC